MFDGIVTGFCWRCKVGLSLTIIVSSDKRIVKITQTKTGIRAAGILSFASISRFIVCRNFLDTFWLIRFGIIYVFVTININLNKNDEILIAGFVSINHLRHCWLILTKSPGWKHGAMFSFWLVYFYPFAFINCTFCASPHFGSH